MIQIPDHPYIRLMETKGIPDDCCSTCKWYYDDEHLCCGTNREPISAPDFESCENWEAYDD